MYLSTSQQQLLTSTLDALLPYANERLGIVSTDTSNETALDHQLRAELVARTLWRNVQLIDDFVAANPASLSERQVACARDMRDVLFGAFVYEGMRDGYAVFAHELGTFLVNRYAHDPVCRMPEPGISIRAALVPFEGGIVAVLPLVGLGLASQATRDRMAKEAHLRGNAEPTASGAVLAERARHWQQEQGPGADDDTQTAAQAAPGYHVGALVGLVGSDRLRCQQEHYDVTARASGVHQLMMESKSIMADFFPLTLDECLSVLDEDSLCALAEHYEGLPTTADVPRERLIDMLCERILSDREDRDRTIMWCADQQFDLLRELMQANPISFSHITPSEAFGYFPMIPYVFMLGEKSTFIAWTPPEVRSLLSEVDLDAVAQRRKRLSEAEHAASALAAMCGIISLDDAYERYRAVATEPFDRQTFEQALFELQCCDKRDSYALWTHQGVTYVISAELSDDSALTRVIRWCYADRFSGAKIDLPLSDDAIDLSEVNEEELDHHLDRELSHLDTMRLTILASERDLPPYRLEAGLLAKGLVDYLLDRPPLAQIRDYVDRHVPDEEDEYTFPDAFAKAVLISVVFERDHYDDVLDIIRLFGMQDCEGSRYPHALGRLITDAFNMLPRWELNGWSLAENTERLTGSRPLPASAALRKVLA